MSKYVDAILGHAVGDAMGVPTEFCIREKLLKNPVKEMVFSEKVGQPAGSWSDDTSMEISTIESFLEKNKFDYSDIMHKWTEWINDGKYTANGETFDVGRTCLSAIRQYSNGITPVECGLKDEMSNGNGSLMRILPVALYSYSKNLSDDDIISLTNDISSLTHGHDISKLGCYIYVKFVIALLQGKTKEEAYKIIQNTNYSMYDVYAVEKYRRILKENIKDYSINEISSKGYVVDTLECALWILMNAKDYREVVFSSTNIGNDTDTIGAIAGSMAGIIYGVNSIPNSWLNKLLRKDYLIDLSLKFEKTTSVLKKDVILGTVIGDVAGSRFEINDCKTGKNFVLLHDDYGRFTDDSVMTLATAETLLRCNDTYSNIQDVAINTYVEIGRKYLKCGFGGSFYNWLQSEEHKPYGSYGNGAAMRISPVGCVIDDINQLKYISAALTNISHNHEDSIKGAEAVCIAVNMSLNNKTKDEIKQAIESELFEIDSSRKELMSKKEFHINCVETVKQALIAFLDSYDFEDAIRNAIAMGGDSDTIGAITGSIAAAYYGIPEELCNHAMKFLDDFLIDIHNRFNEKVGVRNA
jgi:ADP-ribosyl-[dinitrogen reductase] hydrolase